jgi:hypothetical protein
VKKYTKGKMERNDVIKQKNNKEKMTHKGGERGKWRRITIQ